MISSGWEVACVRVATGSYAVRERDGTSDVSLQAFSGGWFSAARGVPKWQIGVWVACSLTRCGVSSLLDWHNAKSHQLSHGQNLS